MSPSPFDCLPKLLTAYLELHFRYVVEASEFHAPTFIKGLFVGWHFVGFATKSLSHRCILTPGRPTLLEENGSEAASVLSCPSRHSCRM